MAGVNLRFVFDEKMMWRSGPADFDMKYKSSSCHRRAWCWSKRRAVLWYCIVGSTYRVHDCTLCTVRRARTKQHWQEAAIIIFSYINLQSLTGQSLCYFFTLGSQSMMHHFDAGGWPDFGGIDIWWCRYFYWYSKVTLLCSQLLGTICTIP